MDDDVDLIWFGITFPNAPSPVIRLKTEVDMCALAQAWPLSIVFLVDQLEDL